ncbi:MAG: hypothetical protein CL927_14485 [Deltaproteobacteria bacterium]|nr:hypothetical protein [Deltaproteobacteria bacterium]
MPKSLSRSVADVVDRATHSAERAIRDAAFRSLLQASPPQPLAIEQALRETAGIVERSDRLVVLGSELHDVELRVALMGWAACHDPSLYVRLEAGRGLVAAGASAEPMLLKVLEAALARGERPGPSGVGDAITPILQVICLSGGPVLDRLLDRVVEGVPIVVGMLVVDLLVATGRPAALKALGARLVQSSHGNPNDAREWGPLQLHLAEAVLGHGGSSPMLLVSVACSAPITRLRIQALDALTHPDPQVIEPLREMVSGRDGLLSRAAARVWARAGADGLVVLRAIAEAALPTPSAAWWVLVEAEPTWCVACVVAREHTTGVTLLPARGNRPAGARLLYMVARSEAGVRLRMTATRRLLGLGAVGRLQSVSLWLHGCTLGPPTDGSGASPEHTVAAMVFEVPDTLLACAPSLLLSLDAMASTLTFGEVERLAEHLCVVAAPDADAPAGAFAGLLYHRDAGERLRAGLGLCQCPMPTLFHDLVQRAVGEREPLVQRWLCAAAWMAARAQPEISSLSEVVLHQLVQMNPKLAAALRPAPEGPIDGRDAQLAEWLALDSPARVDALIALSREHRGRKLTRIQARDLSRALTQPGRARHVVGLLMNPNKPGALARALVVARRAGAGRSRRAASAELALEEAWVDTQPEPVDVGPTVEPTDDSSDMLPYSNYFTDEFETRHDHPRRPLLPFVGRARVLSPIRPDIGVVLERLELIARDDDALSTWTLAERTPMHLGLPARSIDALRASLKAGPLQRWARMFPEAKGLEWPAERPLVLTEPTALAALSIVCDLVVWSRVASPACVEFGRLCADAWDAVLQAAPPDEPELSHLAQTLFVFGRSFPVETSRLLERQHAHHPQWRPLLYAAWLAWRERLDRNHFADGFPRVRRVQDFVACSVLAQTLARRIPSLVEPLPSHRSRPRRPWLEPVVAAPEPSEPSAPEADPARHLAVVAPVLAAGAWSMEGLDYPSFRVTVREGFSPHLRDRWVQQRIAAGLAVIATVRRVAEHGRPVDLLRLLWCRDLCLPETSQGLPWTRDPVDDEGLLETQPTWERPSLDWNPVDDFDLPPLDDVDPILNEDRSGHTSAAKVTDVRPRWSIEALLALPADHPRSVARWIPPAHRRLVLHVLHSIRSAEECTDDRLFRAPSWWVSPECEGVLQQVIDDARAYMVLRVERPGRTRIARKTLRRFWRRPDAADVPSLHRLRERFGADRMIEGLVQGLLVHLVDGPPPASTARAVDKQQAIRTLRQLCLAWNFDEPSAITVPSEQRQVLVDGVAGRDSGWMSNREVHEALRTLHRTVEGRPRELAVTLGLSDAQGLPALLGGARTSLERGCAELLSKLAPVLFNEAEADDQSVVFELRPLTKAEAVHRGDRAGDCSSNSVPFRCMSPHHIYYGVWRDGLPQRGYLTLFEAAVLQDDDTRVPTLVLETINIPIPLFDFVQLDLVHIVEAIAHHRGLALRIAMVTEWWAWNYANKTILRKSKAARAGTSVCLQPADPWCWAVYQIVMPEEAKTYSPFQHTTTAVLLQSVDPTTDLLQPENVGEAERIRALPRKTIVPTAWEGDTVTGFISSMPGAH